MTAIDATAGQPAHSPRISPVARLWNRELYSYPGNGVRYGSLAIVILTTVFLYYVLYVGAGVATSILSSRNMSFVYFVNLTVIANVLGAIASVVAGVSDRYGRANIVTFGLGIVALVSLVGIPLTKSELSYAIFIGVIGFVEGIMLVATPALIRDFSPQLGRASAMGFWTLGPVLGSLVVSVVVTNTTDHLAAFEDQYIICGIVGLVVFAIALFGLRELSPQLRDQLMVSHKDRALIEARAKGLDISDTLKKPFRQMLHLDIIGSAIAISLFLVIYFISVAFLPVFFQTIFGYSQSKANSLGNYLWAFDAGALLVVGYLSDKLRVRKPFMIVGALGGIAFTIWFLVLANDASTSYATFAVVLSILAVFLAFAFAPWMASFTETVERRNPALTATGLAVWGLTIRAIVAIVLFIGPFIVTTVSTLVDNGPRLQYLTGAVNPNTGKTTVDPKTGQPYKYAAQINTLAELGTKNPAAAAALGKNPTDTAAQVSAVATLSGKSKADVARALTLSAQYKDGLAAAAKLKPQTTAALQSNPTDPQVQAEAVSEISGTPVADVAKVITLGTKYAAEIMTAKTIDPQTQTTLVTNKTDTAAIQKAVGEIAAGLKISAAEAQTRLAALAAVPVSDLLFLQQNAAPVQAAANGLMALGKIPAADLSFLATSGAAIQKAGNALAATSQVPKADVAFFAAHAPDVVKAKATSHNQWQHYFWYAVGGEIIFIPLVFLMAGFWDPRKAKRAEEEHEVMVQREMAALAD